MRDNDRSRIIVAAGSVTLTEKPLLPVVDISEAELRVVRLAWVQLGPQGESVPTAADAAALLGGDGPGLAVIAGPADHGKRTAGIKAMWDTARSVQAATGKSLALREIRPDWDTPDSPDTSVLPDAAGTAYLLDVAAEIGSWKSPGRIAEALVAHAEALRRVGSCLVVIADERTWPEGSSGTLTRVLVRAKTRPSSHRVAEKHLELLHRRPDRIRWLNTATVGSDPIGEAAHLLTESSSPADGARLAAMLSDVDDEVPGSLQTALDSFQEWHTEVDAAFKATQDNPDDRALLIASVFLSGSDVLSVQEAARTLLDEPQETKVRTILTGPDLTTRLTQVGAQVEGRTVSVDYRPGYARAVLLHLWKQRADIHRPLLNWVDAITSPKQPGAGRLGSIGDLLVHLAIAENDIRVIEQIHAWTGSGHDSEEHRGLIARVLTVAAEADSLGAAVRARLLDWAQDESDAVATVVALVCAGQFADRYPRQALVRLRHILNRPSVDRAVRTAQEALRDIATRDGQLPRVWSTIRKWLANKQVAGHRAFLSLLDPRADPYVLQVMLTAAERDEEIKGALIAGWSAALVDERVDAECRELLTAWARARAVGQVPEAVVTGILDQVVVEHLSTTPISALIFGEPGVAYEESVIELRKDLRRSSQLPESAFGDELLEP
ncbi:hypothetical protein [Streptomyces alboflavus]|uniref:hypothetical protein n=1 Tax=Streptomyces alboflavus TaxID=67267 RepID=UPI0004CCEF54|nr:hypothetical protein [Streptomyces alboflavus]